MLSSARKQFLGLHASKSVVRAFAAVAEGRVKDLKSNEDFTRALKGSTDELAIIDFTAKWCGPCKVMAPIYAALSEKFNKVAFYKADIDDEAILDSVSAQEISAVPTFTFHKGGKRLAAVTGADPTQIKQLLEKHQ